MTPTREQLASIEWSLYVDTQRRCPACSAPRREGIHKSDCWLAACLAAPILARAFHDRDTRPWRYYQLDAAQLQKMCEHLADKVAAFEAKTDTDSPQNAAPPPEPQAMPPIEPKSVVK